MRLKDSKMTKEIHLFINKGIYNKILIHDKYHLIFVMLEINI